MFIFNHVCWDRKMYSTELIYDGIFQTWEHALTACLTLIMNDEIDPGEIPNVDDPQREEFNGEVPETEDAFKAFVSKYGNVHIQKFHKRYMLEAWVGNRLFCVRYNSTLEKMKDDMRTEIEEEREKFF